MPAGILTHLRIIFLILWSVPMSFSGPVKIIAISTKKNPTTNEIVNELRSVCGNNADIEEFDMKGHASEGKKILKKIKKKLGSMTPAVIFTMGAPATELAQSAWTDIPILYSMVVNPEKKGFVGENISGIAWNVPIKIQLTKLKTIVPTVQNIGIIYNPENSDNIIKEATQAASELALTLVPYEILSPKKVPHAVRGIINKVHALLIITDSTVINKDSFQFVITATLENKIPTIAYTPYLVKAGFLCSVTLNHASIGRQAGEIICGADNMIRSGKSVTSTPEVFRLSINMKTANRIGLTIPPDIIKSTADVFN